VCAFIPIQTETHAAKPGFEEIKSKDLVGDGGRSDNAALTTRSSESRHENDIAIHAEHEIILIDNQGDSEQPNYWTCD